MDGRRDVLTLTIISVVVGLALAVAYHFLSIRLQRWVAQKKALMQPSLIMLSFFVRLAIFAAILVVLGLWSPLNILAVCLSFVVVFTVLNGILLYATLVKRRGTPPSAGTTGAS